MSGTSGESIDAMMTVAVLRLCTDPEVVVTVPFSVQQQPNNNSNIASYTITKNIHIIVTNHLAYLAIATLHHN